MRTRATILVLAALLASGCVEYDEEIVVGADGSGRIRIEYTTPASAARLFETFAPVVREQGIDVPLSFTKEAIEKAFRDPAVSDLAVVVDRGEETAHVKITFAFSSAGALAGKSFLGCGGIEYDPAAKTLRRTWNSPLALAKELAGGRESPLLTLLETRLAAAPEGDGASFRVTLPGRKPSEVRVGLADLAERGIDLTFPAPAPGSRESLLAALDELASRVEDAGRAAAARIAAAKTETEKATAKAKAEKRLAELRREFDAIQTRAAALPAGPQDK